MPKFSFDVARKYCGENLLKILFTNTNNCSNNNDNEHQSNPGRFRTKILKARRNKWKVKSYRRSWNSLVLSWLQWYYSSIYIYDIPKAIYIDRYIRYPLMCCFMFQQRRIYSTENQRVLVFPNWYMANRSFYISVCICIPESVWI